MILNCLVLYGNKLIACWKQFCLKQRKNQSEQCLHSTETKATQACKVHWQLIILNTHIAIKIMFYPMLTALNCFKGSAINRKPLQRLQRVQLFKRLLICSYIFLLVTSSEGSWNSWLMQLFASRRTRLHRTKCLGFVFPTIKVYLSKVLHNSWCGRNTLSPVLTTA